MRPRGGLAPAAAAPAAPTGAGASAVAGAGGTESETEGGTHGREIHLAGLTDLDRAKSGA